MAPSRARDRLGGGVDGRLRGAGEPRLDRLLDLAHLERLALDLVEPERVDEERRAQHLPELARVELGDEDVLEVADDLREPRLERRQPAQVRVRDLVALREQRLLRLAERAERAAPADDEHLAALGAREVELAEILRDPLDLLGA